MVQNFTVRNKSHGWWNRRTQSPLIAMPTSPSPHIHARKSQPTRASSPLQRYTAQRRGSSEAASGLGGRRAKKPPSLRLATAPSGALAEPTKRGKVRFAPHAQRRARKHARRVLACCNAPSPAPRHHRRPRAGISANQHALSLPPLLVHDRPSLLQAATQAPLANFNLILTQVMKAAAES